MQTRNYAQEFTNRVDFIKQILTDANCNAIVFGNSGGKDSALAAILCKVACDDTLGVMMPCESKRNFGEDISHAKLLANQFKIENITVDLTETKAEILRANPHEISNSAKSNIAPRLRMTTLYAIAQSRGALVVGTSNRSEMHVGYFTKHGDGASDFNPIADLTATEVLEFLRFLKAPAEIIEKPPSAGLFEGQTDEKEFGFTYKSLDDYLLMGDTNAEDTAKIEQMHKLNSHKLSMPKKFKNG